MSRTARPLHPPTTANSPSRSRCLFPLMSTFSRFGQRAASVPRGPAFREHPLMSSSRKRGQGVPATSVSILRIWYSISFSSLVHLSRICKGKGYDFAQSSRNRFWIVEIGGCWYSSQWQDWTHYRIASNIGLVRIVWNRPSFLVAPIRGLQNSRNVVMLTKHRQMLEPETLRASRSSFKPTGIRTTKTCWF